MPPSSKARRTGRATGGEREVNRCRPLVAGGGGGGQRGTPPPPIESGEPTTQELLLTLLGVVIGAVTALAWRTSEQQLHPTTAAAAEPGGVPAGVSTVLNVLESSALVVDEHDEVLQASAQAYSLGLVRAG